MTTQQEFYEGKAKRVTPRSEEEVAVFYKDDATAFNGEKRATFAGKGALNSLISEKLFAYLQGRGIATHHLGRLDERTLLSKRVQIIPLECVVRFKVAGSLKKRTGLPENTPCSPPVVELYYKRDDLGDPLLTDDHIRLLGLATPEEVTELRRRALDASLQLKALLDAADLDLVDLKFEFGRTPRGIVLADEISPDTCRFRDRRTGEILDKDIFRESRGDLLAGYREVLRRIDATLQRLGDVQS